MTAAKVDIDLLAPDSNNSCDQVAMVFWQRQFRLSNYFEYLLAG